MSIHAIIEDLHSRESETAGYLVFKVRQKLETVAESDGMEDGTEYLDRLIQRVRLYYMSLTELEVPVQELGRHQRLLCAFEVYEEALEAFLHSIVRGEVFYEPDLVDDLHWADTVVKEHREHSAQNQSVDAYF